MKSLAERHIDRAQRKADNAVFSGAGNVGGNLGAAAVAIAAANEAIAGLTAEQREELHAMGGFDRQEHNEVYGDGFDGNGNLRTAGVGVVNPLIMPPEARANLTGTDGGNQGWGGASEASFDPADGNPNGIAVAAQAAQGGNGGGAGGGWSGDGAEGEKPPVSANMSVADLEKIAADEGVDLNGVTNNAGRVEAINKKREETAE